MPTVGIAIPARNERSNMEASLELAACLFDGGLVQEVYVLDHDSDDGTGVFAKEYHPSFKVETCPVGGGKDRVLMMAASLMTATSMLSMDADLRRPDGKAGTINPSFMRQMIEMHLSDNRRPTVVAPKKNIATSRAAVLSGERVQLLQRFLNMPIAGMNGSGAEIKSSVDALVRGCYQQSPSGAAHVPKSSKYGRTLGFVENVTMTARVAAATVQHIGALVSGDCQTVKQYLDSVPK